MYKESSLCQLSNPSLQLVHNIFIYTAVCVTGQRTFTVSKVGLGRMLAVKWIKG